MALTTTNLAALLRAAEDDTDEAPWMTMPEFQYFVARLLVGILRLYARRRKLSWHVTGELAVVMLRPGGGTLTLGPDLFVVEADDRLRASWDLRTESRPPRFVLEIVTEESVERDTAPRQKPALYNAMGVEEYAIYWPYRRDGGPRLFGYRRDEAAAWVAWVTRADGVLWSRALGLGLMMEEVPWLRLVDGEGRRMPAPEEEAEALEESERRAAVLAAEVARLRALLERRSGDPGT